MDSKEFLDSLINKEIWIGLETGEDLKGTLIWNDLETVGVEFIDYNKIKSVILYYKQAIKSIQSAVKSK